MKLSSKLGFTNPMAAFRHKNFLFYWLGMCVSTIGTWMQNTAQPWLAYKLTDSPLLLSLIGVAQFTPMLLFSLFAGVVIDRLPKKKILIFTQSASLLVTLILAVLAWTGAVRYWHILLLSLLLGFVNTLDMPTRQSFIVELVGKEDRMNAIALNSTVFNLARIVGPAVAGILMGYFGIAACFFANSVSFAAVLVSLFFIQPLPITAEHGNSGGGVIANIADGLKYIYRSDVLFSTLMVMAVVGTFAPNFSVLVPVFATKILGQGEAGYGFLMSFMGVGSFFGAMLIAALSKSGPKRFVLFIVPLIIGAFLMLVGATDLFVLTGVMLAMTGFFFVMFTSSANSAMQLNTENDYLGRVMSVYSLVFAGSTPLGNLYAGIFTQNLNARAGFYACGGIVVILMLPIYVYLMRKNKSPV